MSMYHPHLLNGSLMDGPPSPSPTRSKKRKRSDEEEDYSTPTKTRSRAASSQTLGLPTPDEKGTRMLLPENAQFVRIWFFSALNTSKKLHYFIFRRAHSSLATPARRTPSSISLRRWRWALSSEMEGARRTQCNRNK